MPLIDGIKTVRLVLADGREIECHAEAIQVRESDGWVMIVVGRGIREWTVKTDGS